MNLFFTSIGIGIVLLLYFSWKANRNPGASMPPEARQQFLHELNRPRRVQVIVPVQIAGAGRTIAGFTQNIGAGGMLLRPDGELSIGEPVMVCFALPNRAQI